MRSLVIFGASGHAKVVIDAAEKMGLFKIIGIVDDNPKASEVFEYKFLGGREVLSDLKKKHSDLECFVAVGNNKHRREIANWLRSEGFKIPTIIHPSSIHGKNVILGSGTVCMAGSIINPQTIIHEDVILNTNSSIDHDCEIAAGVHVAPGVAICGGVKIGEQSLVGVGARIAPTMTVGDRVTIGAGAVVVTHISDGSIVFGVPAKPSRENKL